MVIRRLGVVLVAAIAAAAMVGPAFSADAVGFVSVQEVFQGYAKTAKSNEELDALTKTLVGKLQVMEANLLLPDADVRELATLSSKDKLSDVESARRKSLEDRQKTLDKELTDLQAKKEPTAQELARMKELQEKQAKGKENIDKAKDESDKAFQARSKELSGLIREDILKAIEAVAKDKKYSLIVDKDAVLFGGTDVTKDVLEKLGKNK